MDLGRLTVGNGRKATVIASGVVLTIFVTPASTAVVTSTATAAPPTAATSTAVAPNYGIPTVSRTGGSERYQKNGSFRVEAEHFGIHSFSVNPDIPAGAIRVTGSPTWREVQPKRNVWRWSLMDQSLDRAERWGFRDVSFVFLGTPKWAGKVVGSPTTEVLGPRSTSAPTRMRYWRAYVRNVVKRYGDRISSYQVWNEATSPQFYQGTPKRMARMTEVVNKIIDKYDGSAKVIAASLQGHRQSWFDSFAVPYLNELRKRDWPVDVLSGHFYSDGPDYRLTQIRMFNRAVDRARAPARIQRWDTENNYSSGSHDPDLKIHPDGRIRGKKAARFVTRSYLDSWRLGLRRTYWYLWTAAYYSFTSIQMYSLDQPGPMAYQTLANWTVGTEFEGCTTRKSIVRCKFTEGSQKFRIVWSVTGRKTYRLAGKRYVCRVDGSSCKSRSRKMGVWPLPRRVGKSLPATLQ